jgi:hypothetical protein
MFFLSNVSEAFYCGHRGSTATKKAGVRLVCSLSNFCECVEDLTHFSPHLPLSSMREIESGAEIAQEGL